jgi:hypothetical protein
MDVSHWRQRRCDSCVRRGVPHTLQIRRIEILPFSRFVPEFVRKLAGAFA